ncbi:hypothetical protein P872_21625 [Rhodonellum psychrophilum GCM71 = DSM 17998]|uniref:Uncharacterized protein n=1 Tax=Rhodonellum psychrophilum GCM71 = DSM 17998 TaxID=1123057 RepID=U5BX39_9BACT|nr:hypothetical protein P872_21625 [Rhodonellum psychrophilum GCM71 = DSM 17998]
MDLLDYQIRFSAGIFLIRSSLDSQKDDYLILGINRGEKKSNIR